MTQVSSQPKRTSRLPLKILIILLILLGLFLGFMAIRDHVRHSHLDTSINALQASLRADGITTDKSSGCGRPYVEFGIGAKGCTISLTAKMHTATSSEANTFLATYAKSLMALQQFTVNQPLPSSVTDVNGLSFGFASYYHKPTDTICGIDYRFEQTDKQTTIGFSCDDRSWFTRTFGG